MFEKIKIKAEGRDITKYKFLGITIYKKEKLLSLRNYFILGFKFFYKQTKPDSVKTYLFGIRIIKKSINVVENLLKYSQNHDFIYYCFHQGDFYYLCSNIEKNFEKFKHYKILSYFPYNKRVLELFEIDQSWITENFVAVPYFYPSLALMCDKNGKILKHMCIDHRKGWQIDNQSQKIKSNYRNIAETISLFLNESFDIYNSPIKSLISVKRNYIYIFPDSRFNGKMSYDLLKNLIKRLSNCGFKIFINTANKRYDDLLSNNVQKIFLPLKETFIEVSRSYAVIGVRSGVIDCLQSLIHHDVKFFIIYNKIHYPHYKYFKQYYKWVKEVYSFNLINNCNKFIEYFYPENLAQIENDIVDKLRLLKNS